MAHPLCGADLNTLVRAFRQGGWPDRWGSAAGIWAAALLRSPASMLESSLLSRKLHSAKRDEAPIFILGHWRSGTTHLYNIMSLGAFGSVSPVAVGLPWDMFGIARLFRPLLERALPKNRWIDKIPVTPSSPQEDEIGLASMTDLSFYHGIYFPKHFERLVHRGLFFDGCTREEVEHWVTRFRHFIGKLSLQQGQRMLIKNPVYTGRVALLRTIYPGAKFIHIHRNPYDVFLSMRNFYSRLLDVMALQSPPADIDVDRVILDAYNRMMLAFCEDTKDLSAPDFVEIPYALLDETPLQALKQIYETLDLTGYDEAEPAFEEYLKSVSKFEKNAFQGDRETTAMVTENWARWIEKWRYTVPTTTLEHD